LLYLSHLGRQFVDNLSFDTYRWEKDIMRDCFKASESSEAVLLSDEECLIFDRVSGYSLIVQDITERVFNSFKDSPTTITDAVATHLNSERVDTTDLDSLAQTIVSLIRLVRNGVLIPSIA
ncbi:MAG: hypothetical protein ACFFCO_13375, partial [Promethearchaeota archaeon]